MKKGFSIFVSILMLAAMLHLSIAAHYCGGKETALKVSLTGKLADCGMEDSKKELPLAGTNFTKQCCDDIVTYFGIYSNYEPSFSFVPESYHHNFQALSVSAGYPVQTIEVFNSLHTNVSPPGVLMSTNVDLSDICVFRI